MQKAYDEIMAILKDKYNIQRMPADTIPFAGKTWDEDRVERNAALKEALRKLFELESWEWF